METRYTLAAPHMTHDASVTVIDTQPENPAERVVATFKKHEDAIVEATRLNNEFAQHVRQMRKQGLEWTRAYKSWAWLRPFN